MASVRDVALLRRQREAAFEPNHRAAWGVLVEVDGSVIPPGQPGMAWVLEYGRPNSAAKYLNPGALSEPGTPVSLGPAEVFPFRKIEGVYSGAVNGELAQVGRYALPRHAANHQMPDEADIGPDPVRIYMPAIMPLKSVAAAGLIVVTYPYEYIHNGRRRRFPGAYTDMGNYLPDPGTACQALLYLDPATNQLMVETGPSVPDAPTIPAPYPDVPEGGRPSAWVRLTGEQTTISMATDVTNARDLFGGAGDAGGTGGGAPADATYITQTANGTLENEQALSALATGLLKNTTGTGVLSIATAGTDYETAGAAAAVASDLSTHVGDTNNPHSVTPTQLNLVIGTDVQAWDADLDTLAGLAKTKGNLIVGDGTNWLARGVGSNGQVLMADSGEDGGVKWATIAGTGDVVGPSSATDNGIVRFDGTTGKLVQDSAVTINDDGLMTLPGGVDAGLMIGDIQLLQADTAELDIAGSIVVRRIRCNDGIRSTGSIDRIQLWIQGNATQTAPIVTVESSNGTDRMTVTDGGQLTLPTTGSGAGILIGGDVQLYRSAADVLRTPDSVVVDSRIGIGSGATAPEFPLDIVINHSAATDFRVFNANSGTGAVARAFLRAETAQLFPFAAGDSWTGVAEFAGKSGMYTGSSGGNLVLAARVSTGGIDMYTGGSGSGNLSVTISSAGVVNLARGNLQRAGVQLLTTRRTGWGAPTGTATRTAFDTSTVTTAQLAERVKALIDDLTTHGLIGS